MRYRWAAQHIPEGALVLDAACGIGYGTSLLATAGALLAVGVDIDEPTLAFAREHYAHERAEYIAGDCMQLAPILSATIDAVVSLETIEHVPDHMALLAAFHRVLKPRGLLIGSTPNEVVRPWAQRPQPFHTRHFTPDELRQALDAGGFDLAGIWHQKNKRQPAILPGPDGEFMIFIAERRP
jgi:2-polyprenyl-3-methyl-5-hydroxy-6-metoxy-1,4-benzoquinol methylase